ncbi:MAG: protein phosphatase [Deltaproteobacteria bacterium CG11_big_fil_rev_8_21_14_0_20_42_23]|nr:MAG: protein phosphatase [Deltaproteobacteria bacterium CG11_big_fil_rev_8_21_14_0_20_42_23]PJC63566.1 MAG: serine/threonine-protein phosphatase [Deltaproteobacteria bacterium CG_4_9_14_0_2_um_filter_42_21]
MQVRFAGKSDVGKRRQKNEDSYIISEKLNLAIVADGMGGHLGGERASKLAVETVKEIIDTLEGDPETTLEEGMNLSPGDYRAYIRYAISMASAHIFDESKKVATLKGMGTTTVMLLFRNNLVYIGNVGDSRAYRVRDGEVEQITQDHSLVGEQIRAGLISEEDAKSHRLKNIITRSVGFQDEVEADVEIRALNIGDKFLLCSDGLSNLIDANEIKDILVHNSLDDASARLIDLANERGGDDNITVVLAEVEALSAAASEDETIEA